MLKNHHSFRYGTQAFVVISVVMIIILFSVTHQDNDVVVFEPNPGRRKRSKQGGQYMMSKAIRRSIQEWENENDKEDNDRVGSSAEDRSKAAFASDNLPVEKELMSDLEDLLLFNDIGLNSLTGLSYELSLKGSPYWMAPEVMIAMMHKDGNPNIALVVDIWSLDCTVIEMLTGKPPWSELEGLSP
ncbi:hypothetical protein JRO89_XS07G0089800 [Xanthoceras sorbifolium]|uniref:Protein kinase domain-containing protein n=1 Tax=Xanthoceras sorbifolium TaxID=99658 RepID=A0ABQ8HTC1_9ROSI|nr:hypothetical protein JRO89_XS07G0089800 [Xanthoceras sorbifolium]